MPHAEEQDDYPVELGALDHVEPVTYPSSAGATVYVYFDEDLFRDDEAIETIIQNYQQEHSTTAFQPMLIKRRDLQSRRYFAFPRTERGFVKDGYAAEFDLRKGDEGPVTTAYLSAQKSVLHVQAALLFHTLKNVGPTFFGWAEQFTDNGVRLPDYSDRIHGRTLYDLAPLLGEESMRQGAQAPGIKYALVDWQGLRLGNNTVGRHDRAHLAFGGTPNSWLKNARAAISAGFFGQHPVDRIARQINQELSEAGLGAFFGAQHWRHREAPVTAGAVLTWQSQTIGSLRKLLWQAEAEEGAPLLKNELMKERRALRGLGVNRNPIGAGRLPAGEPETRFRDIFAKQIQEFADRFLGVVAEEDDNILDEIVSTSVDERDILIGALCGSGIDLRQPDEKPDPVFELAWWLAHLRQKGEAQLSGDFAVLFEEVKRDTREELTDLLYASLSDNVWTGLLEAADEIGRTDQTMVVSYTWGSVEQPWAVLREGNEIKITGPLLYFPVTEAGKWARLAELIAANGDFVVPE